MGGVRKLLMACVLLVAPGALAASVLDSSLRLTAEERYDDDLRLAEGGEGQFMTKLTPRLGLELKDPRSTGEGFYAADLLMRHGSGKATLDHRGGLDLRHTLTRRLRLDFTGRIFRVTDPTSLPRDGLARSLEPIVYGKARLGLSGRVTQRLDVRATYAFEGAKVYEEGREPGFVHTPTLEAWYRSTRRLTLGLEYRYQGFLFGDSFSDAHGAFAGLRYRLTRPTTLTLRGGPVLYRPEPGKVEVLPRIAVELAREGELFDVGFTLGHDLVGASGFTNTLWADYASLVLARRFNARWSVYGGGSFFRNGRAPGEGAFSLKNTEFVSQGYAVGGGIEYRLNRYLTLQGAVDRIAQVGADEEAAGVDDLARNVAAVRLMLSAW
ncbi:hypothetical protein [Hyalangium rubrum]|uniref:Porin n=1 Tax=Hyalangium rubrum TaxID=3103134 RepID=A0ABU5HBV8_9BACT|nr:hypothetical protein [Hyalangium sp. s54d21]MDY7230746.1 hypothetical protein [Hyalangium sp. s54d21]